MNPIQSVIEYFRTSKAELEKVSWPSKKDTIRYSSIVIVASVAAAIFFGVLDYGLHEGVTSLVRRAPAAATAPTDTVPLESPIVPDLLPQVEAVTKDGNPASVTVTPAGTDSQTTNPAGTVK